MCVCVCVCVCVRVCVCARVLGGEGDDVLSLAVLKGLEGHADALAGRVERRPARVARVDRGIDLHRKQVARAMHVLLRTATPSSPCGRTH